MSVEIHASGESTAGWEGGRGNGETNRITKHHFLTFTINTLIQLLPPTLGGEQFLFLTKEKDLLHIYKAAN